MITQELIDYIKEQLNEGIDKEEIKKALLDVGWQIEDIEEGFRLLEQGEFKVPQPEFKAEPEPKFKESIVKTELTPEVESPIESETKVEPELESKVEVIPEVTFEPKAQPQPESRLESTPQYKPEFEFKPETPEKEQTVWGIETPQQPLTEPSETQPEIPSTRSEKEWLQQPPSFMSSDYQLSFPSKEESALAGLSSSLPFKIFAMLTLVVFVITLGVMIYTFLRPRPLDIVETSINKLLDADSVLVEFQGDEQANLDNVRGTIYGFKDDSLYSKSDSSRFR